MNRHLLSLGSLAALLAITSPVAAQVPSLTDEATQTFNSEFVKPTEEVFTNSTSAESLESFEVQGKITPTVTSKTNKTEVAQFGRTTYQKESGIYVGGNIGVFIPTYDDLKTGFGGGGYVGYKFNKNWGAEVDINYVGTESDIDDDTDVNALTITGNVRYVYPLGSSYNPKWSLFGTLGAGISDLSIENDRINLDDSEGLFSFQAKVGASYKFTNNFEAFGQLRYIYIADGDITLGDGGFFSPELGVQYKF